MMFRSLSVAVMCLSAASPALARQDLPAQEAQTRGIVGISIPFGGDMQPRIDLAIRKANVTSDGDVTGGELRLTIDPQNPRDAQIRLLGLRGTVDHQGALGAGWDFGVGRPVLSGGVMLPYLSGFGDFGLDGLSPRFSVGIQSAGQIDKPEPRYLPCGARPLGLSGRPVRAC